MTDQITDADRRYLQSYVDACETVIETILDSLEREDRKKIIENLKELYVL